ncbi:MAG: bifunctional precorrin-2 dehydrogenase/sirohydrochlorin ferrochelatase [Fusobacterium sp.]|uniref:precorrin-2 dehydrogenase/sirohydrochlorin ferrochelatase family protein n=1 Tax=Fusobacterium sp. TaxID=68766 RepID=UPI0026DD735F|nr:bifunctional precorrin-2 dehydrogenase/sirohydrochlorin ferrochelatase [Fusobacterium sp.]MDO4689707.1 bifunctional precorrin-2 dehydrogenase/sirohydrochlorin ferrochelatase [Fusobacterium sp.]
MESKFFPVSIDLTNKNVLVVGAGKIAFRKVETLVKQGCNIKVITRTVEEQNFEKLLKDKKIFLEIEREFKEEDLKDIFLVVAATSDEKMNKYISELCISRNILVNNISSKTDMNLRFSSIFETEDFQIAVSTKEGNPKKALEIRDMIRDCFNRGEK